MTATTVRLHGLVAGEQHHHVCKIWKNLFVLCVLSSRKCKARAKCVLTCSAVLAGSVLSMRRANRAVCVSRWVQRLPFHTNAEGLPTSSFHIASFFSCCFRAVSPTRGQCVAAMEGPTGTTVSCTGMLVWPAWRSKWPMMDTVRVGASGPVAYPYTQTLWFEGHFQSWQFPSSLETRTSASI